MLTPDEFNEIFEWDSLYDSYRVKRKHQPTYGKCSFWTAEEAENYITEYHKDNDHGKVCAQSAAG
jgi:hypothetical protein